MSDKREHQQVDTSANAKMDKKQEPGLPVKIPLSIVRWILYSVSFMLFLIPFFQDTRQLACGGLILGWFASQLNAIIKK